MHSPKAAVHKDDHPGLVWYQVMINLDMARLHRTFEFTKIETGKLNEHHIVEEKILKYMENTASTREIGTANIRAKTRRGQEVLIMVRVTTRHNCRNRWGVGKKTVTKLKKQTALTQ